MKIDIKKKLGQFPLYMNIEYSKKNKILNIFIDIPDGYSSPLINAIKEGRLNKFNFKAHGCKSDRITLACCKISFPKSSTNIIKNLVLNENKLLSNTKYIYIELLYNNALLFPELINEEEKIALKGIGKTMFCVGLGYCLEEHIIKLLDLDKTYVILQAGSDNCYIDSKYDNYSETDLILELYRNYPFELHSYLEKCFIYKTCIKNNVEELKDYLCYIKANENLIKYYKKEYNLNILHEGQGLLTVMYAKVNDVIDKCKDNFSYLDNVELEKEKLSKTSYNLRSHMSNLNLN